MRSFFTSLWFRMYLCSQTLPSLFLLIYTIFTHKSKMDWTLELIKKKSHQLICHTIYHQLHTIFNFSYVYPQVYLFPPLYMHFKTKSSHNHFWWVIFAPYSCKNALFYKFYFITYLSLKKKTKLSVYTLLTKFMLIYS